VERKHNELIAKEGWIFFFPLVVAAILALIFLDSLVWGAVLGVLAFYVALFFRNPYRQIPEEAGTIVSPADGKVVAVRQMDDGRHQVSIFLNIFNVHINRSPIAGTVEEVNYTKGRFLSADKAEASTENERNKLVIRNEEMVVEVTQVAGLIARRIVCWTQKDQSLSRGQRFGLIRFGSRTDLVLPATCQIQVRVGQKVSGGKDIIAKHKP